jgi:hypothetical protein
MTARPIIEPGEIDGEQRRNTLVREELINIKKQ